MDADAEGIIGKLAEWAETTSGVGGLLLYGSTADETASPYSDLNVAVSLVAGAPREPSRPSLEGLHGSLEERLGKLARFSLLFPRRQELATSVFYLDSTHRRLELVYFSEVGDLDDLVVSRGNSRVLYDPSGDLERFWAGLPAEVPNDRLLSRVPAITRDVVANAVYAFEVASESRQRGDQYRYYHAFNQMLHRAAQLHAILEGQFRWWFRPKQLLSLLMEDAERKFFRRSFMGAEFNPDSRRDNALLRDFLDWFYDLLERVEGEYGAGALPRARAEIEAFCEDTYERDFLWNFRPVQGARNLFRASRPTAYAGDLLLEKWLVEKGVSTIIDLRRARELDNDPHPVDLYGRLGIRLLNVNFDPPEDVEVDAKGYVKNVLSCRDATREIFRAIAASKGSVLFHCASGKDRTGILASLLQLLLGVPESTIVQDYLLSGVDTRPDKIRPVLQHLSRHGGIVTYLHSCGLDDGDLAAVRNRISPHPKF
ncbi:MAG: tyrosine-protein phosphatase [Promethearchaeota archaeon]